MGRYPDPFPFAQHLRQRDVSLRAFIKRSFVFYPGLDPEHRHLGEPSNPNPGWPKAHVPTGNWPRRPKPGHLLDKNADK